MKLIERLFQVCAKDPFCIDDEESLRYIYEMLPETSETDAQINAALAKAGLVKEEQRAVVLGVYWEICESLEKRGFLNGFRYGVQMMRETENN